MDNFSVYLESWRVFYGVIAGASATLMGLIFLSVSLHLDIFKKSMTKEPQQIAWQTFFNFFWAFTSSVVFLLPRLTSLSLGLIILLLGLVAEYVSSRRWWRARKHLPLNRALIAFVPLAVCYMVLTVSGFCTTLGLYRGLDAVAPVTVFLIGISIGDAWRLLINSADQTGQGR
jgi:hypothetical protein